MPAASRIDTLALSFSDGAMLSRTAPRVGHDNAPGHQNPKHSLSINLTSAFHAIRAVLTGMKAWMGSHHLHRVRARPGVPRQQLGLCRLPARRHRPHQAS
jgi:hypothetical protein